MIGFSEESLFVSTPDGLNFTLCMAFTFTRKNGEAITVPIGTKSDGASTPRLIWREIPPFGIYWRAAFLHDYLYRDTERPKAECDDIFLEAMESLGTPAIESRTIYEGVHLFGWASFDGDRKAEGGTPQ